MLENVKHKFKRDKKAIERNSARSPIRMVTKFSGSFKYREILLAFLEFSELFLFSLAMWDDSSYFLNLQSNKSKLLFISARIIHLMVYLLSPVEPDLLGKTVNKNMDLIV